MSYACLILGESGTGKTCSLRNLDPKKCLLIQPVRKPLPFKSTGWKHIQLESKRERVDNKIVTSYRRLNGGNILCCTDIQYLIQSMHETTRPIIIIDDWQYFLSFSMMDMRYDRGYDKWTEIGGRGFDLAKASSELSDEKRVYILAHTQTEGGHTRIKTIGKLLDEKIVIEGMFTTVLRTQVINGQYLFSTQNNGADTVKSPMGMFDSPDIENDLAAVDAAICDYYQLNHSKE